jgi:hypothetical protein
MASIDIVPGPVADIARAEGMWSKVRYHAAAHPLGVVGAVIMAVFVFAAIFADVITASQVRTVRTSTPACWSISVYG